MTEEEKNAYVAKEVADYLLTYSQLEDEFSKTGDKVIDTKGMTKPEDKEKVIRDIMDGIEARTGCMSCPLEGKCRNLNWEADQTFVEVVGCLQHPDQKKFQGHSTTVTITDMTYTQCFYHWVNPGTWATCQSDTTWSPNGALYDTVTDAFVNYVAANQFRIYRGALIIDTSTIPTNATVSAAKFSLYCYYKGATTTGSADIIVDPDNVYPQDAVPATDYNIANYDTGTVFGTKNHTDITLNAYNDITLTDYSNIGKGTGGRARHLLLHSRDRTNDPLVVVAEYGSTFHGHNNTYPPVFTVTYSVDYWYYVNGTATWNAWDEGWAVWTGK